MVPWYLNGKPYEVQTDAQTASYRKRGFAWWLEQGLGKTALTLNEFEAMRRGGAVDTLVVICPNTMKSDWIEALTTWMKDVPLSAMWPKPPIFDQPHVFVMNYEAVRNRGGFELMKLLKQRRCLLVFDESSEIKNFQSQVAKACIKYADLATAVRELNGTPLTQNVMDIWSQLRVLGAFKDMNPYQFRGRFAKLGGYMGKKVVATENEEELQEHMRKWTFRAMKKDWTDLPPKIYQTRSIELTKEQKKAYADMMEEFYVIVNDMEVTAAMVLIQMSKLQQISSGFVMNDGTTERVIPVNKNPKVLAMLDDARNCPGKFIVVTVYRESAAICREALAQYNPAMLVGGMRPDDIRAEKHRFNTDPNCRCIILQTQAGSKGHTLLGDDDNRCATTLYFENSFSLLHREQIEDRNHRWGQDAEHVLHIDYSASPVEKKAMEALQQKRSVADAVVNSIRRVPLRKMAA